jgi:glyoxylase-like metal-dependent hydrolase (beta-lactamase superfamily II)
MEQLDENLYRIKIPLPGSPLGSVNSYLIKNSQRSLLIDTAFNGPECRTVLEDALNKLEIDRDMLDIFATHLHADHTGLAPHVLGQNSNFYLNDYGTKVLTATSLSRAYDFAKRNGFPDENLDELFERHPGNKFQGDSFPESISLAEDEVLNYDSYSLRVVNTPGHTLGHQCLYDPDRKLLFSGDHVLGDITPNISVHTYETRYILIHYLSSLDKIAELDVELVLPGHKNPFENLNERIAELKHHHVLRTTEVYDILESGKHNAYEVATKISWDITRLSWEEFPIIQQWFATGEALSHLWALEEENKIVVHENKEKTLFSIE